MDPLSIAASACGIAALCGNIIATVGKFIVDTKSIPQSLEEFNTSITTLRTVLNNIDCVLCNRPKHVLFIQKQESKHWQDVKNVLEACNSCLHKLKNEIPELPTDKHRPLQQARIQLELTLKSNVVLQIRGHISSYTQILQLSLTTVTLGSIWETQKSQDLVRSEIQKLTSEIRATNSMIQQRREELKSTPSNDLTSAELLATNLEAWRESAESLAVAVTLYEPDKQSVDRRAESASVWSDMGDFNKVKSNYYESMPTTGGGEMIISSTDSGIEVDETTYDWDPEPENTTCLSIDIIQFQVAANQENVKRLVNDGLYFPAEQYQRKGIDLQDQLLKTHNIPFSNRVDAEETLADILRRQGTKDGLRRGKDILQRLLKEEVEEEHPPEEDRSRCWRLYHKLGEICLELKIIPIVKTCATRALEGRKKLIPAQMDLVLDSAKLLANAYQLNEDYDEASGIRAWIYQQETSTRKLRRVESVPSNSAMADVLRWCKENGFDVDSPETFRFEKPNAKGKTPLHIAVSDERLEIVEEIVNHVKTLETRDNDAATALLLACSTRNRRTTEMLLKKGAKVCVQDIYLNSPLHRVHSASGGTAVARLLLNYPDHPLDINQKNIYDKTALHLACEMANEPMVDLLLDHGADPNCQGPAKCTPLHMAIYFRRISIVKKLLERGADTAIRDNRGLDAVTAAKTTKMASQDIIKLVVEHEHRVSQDRLRRLSQAKSLELSSGERRRSSTASELYPRMEFAQASMVSSPLSLPRKDTAYSRSSVGSGKSSEGQESMSPTDSVSSKSLKSLKLNLRRRKASNE